MNWKIVIALLLAAAISGCRQPDLCMLHPHSAEVEILFDWQYAPDAFPEGMCIWFYPESGDAGAIRRFDLPGRSGGKVALTEGVYNVVAYNNDTQTVLSGDTEDFNSHFCFTREGDVLENIAGRFGMAPKGLGAEGERTVICPERLWSCTARAEVAPGGCIMLFPDEKTCLYSYEIRNVEGIGRIVQMCASISGMSPSVNMSTGMPTAESVTLPIPAQRQADNSIYGEFLTFGHESEAQHAHRLLLYVWLETGEKYVFGTESARFEVTQQVHQAPDRRRVHIVIDGLDMPDPEFQEGMKPAADDWGIVNEDIHL